MTMPRLVRKADGPLPLAVSSKSSAVSRFTLRTLRPVRGETKPDGSSCLLLVRYTSVLDMRRHYEEMGYRVGRGRERGHVRAWHTDPGTAVGSRDSVRRRRELPEAPSRHEFRRGVRRRGQLEGADRRLHAQ